MNLALNTKHAVTVALVAAAPSDKATDQITIKLSVSATIAESESNLPGTSQLRESTNAQNMRIRIDSETWTDSNEQDFSALATKEALGTITTEEAVRLEALSRQRRNAVNPRTEDEILWDIRQRRNTLALVDALTRYVEFYSPVAARR
jgi:hypothetical protein